MLYGLSLETTQGNGDPPQIGCCLKARIILTEQLNVFTQVLKDKSYYWERGNGYLLTRNEDSLIIFLVDNVLNFTC